MEEFSLFPLDKESTIKVVTGLFVVIAAIITGVIAFVTQWSIKLLERNILTKKEKETQRLKLYIPFFRFSYELDSRLDRLLKYIHTDWLCETHLQNIKLNQGFAKNLNETGYFFMSNIYITACFFGWVELMQMSIDTSKASINRNIFIIGLRAFINFISANIFRIPKRKKPHHFDKDIKTVTRLFQYKELFKDYISLNDLKKPKDACNLHRQLQHSIGELMLNKDEATRFKTFREFLKEYISNPEFRYWFTPLEDLFVNLCNFEENVDIEMQSKDRNDLRPLRLLAIRYWCRVLMKSMAHEVGIETPDPEMVLTGVSEKLKNIIKSVKIEELEPYVLSAGY